MNTAPARSTTPPVVWLELPPLRPTADGPDWEWTEVALALPENWQAILEPLAVPDAATCTRCGCPVGFGLEGDADERLVWRTMVLIEIPDKPFHVTSLCEECADDE